MLQQREFKDIRLDVEHIAEFDYRPVACDRDYRVVVVWKSLKVLQGQKRLFDDARAFFYITNDHTTSAAKIVTEHANGVEQHKMVSD